MRTVTITVTGRVQGVGFRYALRAEAERLGTRGWVRNRRDGAVEALVAGDPDAVEGVIAWANDGPPSARVADVDVLETGGTDEIPAAFKIRDTV
ncbi:acylphosphatase [Microbacterium sp. NPDC089188]|uniref:acylphosphatase n=1 Tax=Microbacterium sp. NPDC089188 TaxID=3154971 RepID=UPI003449EA37